MKRIRESENKSGFINTCIEEHIAREAKNMDADNMIRMLNDMDARMLVDDALPSIVRFDAAVACGTPTEVPAYEPEYVDMNKELSQGRSDCFSIFAHGDSMIDAYIHDGDMLIIDPSHTEDDGHYAMLCRIGSEQTVKFVERQPDKHILYPANEDYDPRIVTPEEHLVIVGRVINVVHPPLCRRMGRLME